MGRTPTGARGRAGLGNEAVSAPEPAASTSTSSSDPESFASLGEALPPASVIVGDLLEVPQAAMAKTHALNESDRKDMVSSFPRTQYLTQISSSLRIESKVDTPFSAAMRSFVVGFELYALSPTQTI